MGGMQPMVPGGCQGAGSHGPCVQPSAWGRFHINGLQLPPWDSAWARKPVAYCLHKQFVAKLNLTCRSGGRSPSSTMSLASMGRAGGGFLWHVPPHTPLPFSSGLAPCGIAVPRVSLGPALVRCFPGQAWEGQVLPIGNRLFPASQGSSWGAKGRAGSHGNSGRRGLWPGSSFSDAVQGICGAEEIALQSDC